MNILDSSIWWCCIHLLEECDL